MTRTSDRVYQIDDGIGPSLGIQPTHTPASSADRLAAKAAEPAARRHQDAPPISRSATSAALQVAVIWRGQILGYRLLRRRRKVTVGSSKRATFTTPQLGGQTKFLLLTPRRDGYVLRLAPELKGDLVLGGTGDVRSPTSRSSEVDLGARRSRQADLRGRQRPAHRDPLGRSARARRRARASTTRR